ncbi:MAG: hypothetical protein QNK23_16530 [Crocinitomicaceae bacterium]|nr:hypothetical protein [Crocinitomicaceae bacterium]
MKKFNFNEWGQEAKIVPWYIRTPLVLLALGLEAFFVFSYSGPYKWFVEIQTSVSSGSYYPTLAVLLSLIVVLFPIVVVVRLLVPIYKRRREGVDSDIIDNF